jgi:HlyD family secretion protein
LLRTLSLLLYLARGQAMVSATEDSTTGSSLFPVPSAKFHSAFNLNTLLRQRSTALAILLVATLLLAGCAVGRAAAEATGAPPLEEARPLDADESSHRPAATERAAASSNQQSGDESSANQSAATEAVGYWLYTGEIEAAEEITLIAEAGSRVIEMEVKEGDPVTAGQLLLRMDTTTLEAQRGHALAALQAAQSQVELLQLHVSEGDIEAARAAVAAAEAAYQALLHGPSEGELVAAQSRLFQAEAALRRAQAAYDQVSWNPLIGTLPESYQLQQAKLDLQAAQAQYDNLTRPVTEEVITQAYAELAAARAALQRLEDGPQVAQIEAAEAEVRLAETELYLAQLQLEKAEVRAPLDAIVAEAYIKVGETPQPGSPVLRLFSPMVKINILVEESRLAKLRTGQPARIRASAFPGQAFEGTVTAIAPQVDPSTRTVRVTIRPTALDTPLAPGMSATVELKPE